MVVAFPRLGVGLFRFSPTISLGLLSQLANIISATNFTSVENSIFQSITSSLVFTIRSCYNILNDGGLRSPFKNTIWKSTVPLKVKVFSWLALKDQILSRANLIKRGWQGPSHCCICGHHDEIVMCIFFHYSISRLIWNFLLRDANSSLFSITLKQVFSLKRHLVVQVCNLGWNTLLLVIFWCLWLNRNEVVFRNNNRGVNSIFMHILALTSFWLDHGSSGQEATGSVTSSTLKSLQLNQDLYSNSLGQANVDSVPPPNVNQSLSIDPNAERSR